MRTANVTVFAVPSPRPLVSPPGRVLRLGYTSALMVDAGAQLIGATLDAFPNQYATLAEGGDGNTLDPDKTYVARTAIAAARLMYPID